MKPISASLLISLLAAGLVGHAAAAPTPAPELSGGGPWFNTPDARGLSLASLRNKIVLIEFWTGGCINCLNTLPWVKQWYAKYQSQGLVVIGVHSPEFSHEHGRAYVRDRIAALGLKYPVVMDNDFAIWRAYHNLYWPTLYLIDKAGRIRYRHIGEGNYDATERMIRQLLAESL